LNSISKVAGMLGYYTVKLLGAERIGTAERMRLETAYAARLEATAGGQAPLMALCEAARAEGPGGPSHQRLQEAARQAQPPGVPEGARFSLALWTAQDL
jgi:hypothetical protein